MIVPTCYMLLIYQDLACNNKLTNSDRGTEIEA